MSGVVMIAGSTSHPSKSHALLEYAESVLECEGFQTHSVVVRNLPPEDLVFGRFNSPALRQVKARLAQAQGVIIATPIYKAAYTGVLKAFLDLLPQTALAGKLVLPIATGDASYGLPTIDYALRPILSALGARYVLESVYVPDAQACWTEAGNLQLALEAEQHLKSALHALIGDLSRVELPMPQYSEVLVGHR